MKLSDLDDVTALRNYRKSCLALRETAKCSYMKLEFGGCDSPSSHISLECVREAVVKECDRAIAEYEKRLAEFGVEIGD